MEIIPVIESAAKEVYLNYSQEYVNLTNISVDFKRIEPPKLINASVEFDFFAKYVALFYLGDDNYYKYPQFSLTLPLDFSAEGSISALNELFHINLYASDKRYIVELKGAKFHKEYYREIVGEEYSLLTGILFCQMRNSEFLAKAIPQTPALLCRLELGEGEKCENTITELAKYYKSSRIKAFMLPLYAHDMSSINKNALLCNTFRSICELGYKAHVITASLGGTDYSVTVIMVDESKGTGARQ